MDIQPKMEAMSNFHVWVRFVTAFLVCLISQVAADLKHRKQSLGSCSWSLVLCFLLSWPMAWRSNGYVPQQINRKNTKLCCYPHGGFISEGQGSFHFVLVLSYSRLISDIFVDIASFCRHCSAAQWQWWGLCGVY